MQGDDEHQMNRSIGVSSSQVPQLQLLDDNLEESESAPERRSPDCVIVKEKHPASGLSRRLKNITMEEEYVSEVMGPSSSKNSFPSTSEETNQNDWNMISASSMESGRSVSHRSSDSEEWSFLHSPDYYEKDSNKNMKWDDDETATNWSRSGTGSVSRSSSTRSEILISSISNLLSNFEKDLVYLRWKITGLFLPTRNKLRVVHDGIKAMKLFRLVNSELMLVRKLGEAREVRLSGLWRRQKLKQSIRRFRAVKEEVRHLVAENRKFRLLYVYSSELDSFRRHLLFKSRNIIAIRGNFGFHARQFVAVALGEALNLLVCFDAVIWVALTDCRTIDGIRKEIAKGLGISFPDYQSGSESNLPDLTNIISNTRFLLVLDDLQFTLSMSEMGITHSSILSATGSMVVIITSYKCHITFAKDIVYIDLGWLPCGIAKDVRFGWNAEESLKWYRLEQVPQLHRLLYGDLHLFDRGSGISLYTVHRSKTASDILTSSLEILRCRENILSILKFNSLKHVELPRALNPESWFLNVDSVLAVVRKLQQGEAPPPTLMESMIQLQRDGQILDNSFNCNRFAGEMDLLLRVLKRGKKIVAITGESGIGKTRTLVQTLGQMNFFSVSVTRNVGAVVWITASDVVTRAQIQEMIVDKLTMLGRFTEIQENVEGSKLLPAEALDDLEILIVLDDVRCILDLRQIKILDVSILQLRNTRIVMTSRHKEICNEMGAEVVIEVPLLSVEESKTLVRNIVGEKNYEKMEEEVVDKVVDVYGGGLPRKLIRIGNTMKDATLQELKLLLDHPEKATSKFSVGDGEEHEVCHYFGRRSVFHTVDFYRLDNIMKAINDERVQRLIWE